MSETGSRIEPELTEPVLGGRDEMNIAEFPITLLTDRAPKGQSKIEHQDTICDLRTGKDVTRRLTITAPEEFGLPTSIDDDIIVGLIQLTKHQTNFASPDVTFTRRQLIEVLGWPHKGRSYDRIEESLDRWTSTYLKYENAWWDVEGRRWTSGGFHIIDSYSICDAREADAAGKLARCRVTWGAEFFRSCQVGYLKSLDYELYLGLNFHPARRMYRFLDKRFYHKPEWTFELRDFAIEHVGLSRSYRDAGKIKEKLQPGIEELERAGFLEPMLREDRYRREGKSWSIRMIKRRTPRTSAQAPASAMEEALIRRGVTESTAIELARFHPEVNLIEKLDVFDWLIARADKRVSTSPAGYLVESIRQGYARPKGFEPRADRDRKALEVDHAREQVDRRRREQSDEASRSREEQKAVDAYWAALAPDDRDQIEADALAARPATREVLNSPLRSSYLREAREQHIRDLLKLRKTEPGSMPVRGGSETRDF